MTGPDVACTREPSNAAWRRFGQLAASALARLAERDAVEQEAADVRERAA